MNLLSIHPCEHGIYGICKKCNKKYGHYHDKKGKICHCEYWKKQIQSLDNFRRMLKDG